MDEDVFDESAPVEEKYESNPFDGEPNRDDENNERNDYNDDANNNTNDESTTMVEEKIETRQSQRQEAASNVNTETQSSAKEESGQSQPEVPKRTTLVPKVETSSQFEITITDYEKKGDGMNAFVVYTINTKTTSPDFQNPTMTVSRRFTNFVWLYTQLTTKYPGVVVPPIPEKQALGRFGTNFIDHRKAGLEKCLRRIAAHSVLSKSPDFKLFLESKDLEGDIKKNEPKKGFFSALTSSVTDVMQTASLSFSKIPESDEWFENKRAQLETLENQLKILLKTVEGFIKQRRDLAASANEFGEHVSSLGSSEFNKPLSSTLVKLSEVQKKIHEFQMNQANSDEQYVEDTVEEYLRIIASVKIALDARVKAYAAWKNADAALIRKKEQLAKQSQAPKTPKVTALEAEVEEAEKTVEKTKESFEEITELLKKELARFDREKVEDFQSGLLKFVESMMENQKKTISLWEEFLPEVQAL